MIVCQTRSCVWYDGKRRRQVVKRTFNSVNCAEHVVRSTPELMSFSSFASLAEISAAMGDGGAKMLTPEGGDRNTSARPCDLRWLPRLLRNESSRGGCADAMNDCPTHK